VPQFPTFCPPPGKGRVILCHLAFCKVPVEGLFADTNDASAGTDAVVMKPARSDEVSDGLHGDIQAICSLLYG
jgi:hypothetical protein